MTKRSGLTRAKTRRTLLAAAVLAGTTMSSRAGDGTDRRDNSILPRDALWGVVRSCVLAKSTVGLDFPCVEVDADKDPSAVAILRPPMDDTHLLVVPLARISGLEDPQAIASPMVKVWSRAWDARRLLSTRPVGWTVAGMALNAEHVRSQDQLHIHVDCLAESFIRDMSGHIERIGNNWTKLANSFGGLWGMRVDGARTEDLNPVALASQGLPFPRKAANLGVAGFRTASGREGFLVFAMPWASEDLTASSHPPRVRTWPWPPP
jgi:CDP-diacylglycerol pyrophosphatase